MLDKYMTAAAATAATTVVFLCGVFAVLQELPRLLSACLRARRGRAPVIGFSMKDHQRLPGGSADCSVALLYQPFAGRL